MIAFSVSERAKRKRSVAAKSKSIERVMRDAPGQWGADTITTQVKKKRLDNWLVPLKGVARERKVAMMDIESKEGPDPCAPGFERPFQVGFADENSYTEFRDGPAARKREDWGTWATGPGGCIDKFLRHVFGYPWDWTSRNPKVRQRIWKYSHKHYVIYAHNGGRFDWEHIIGWLLSRVSEFKFEIMSTQARMICIDVWPRGQKKAKGYWRFCDSISIIPLPLDKAIKTFVPQEKDENGKPKGKTKLAMETHEDDPRWLPYNKQDCVAGRQAVVNFLKMVTDVFGGMSALTAPAMAMKLFRRQYLKKWIPRHLHLPSCTKRCERFHKGKCERLECDGNECHGCAHDFVRLAYYGGRTELLQRYAPKGMYYYDINSSYPASMLKDMPAGAMTELEGSDETTLEEALATLEKMSATHIGFVECRVSIPAECKLPPLPYRDVATGKLAFPCGEFEGTWCYEELKLLQHKLVKGSILKVKKSVWYRRRPLFKDMVGDIYRYRDKEDARNYEHGQIVYNDNGEIENADEFNEGMAYVAKLILNSLYGKFGMRELREGLIIVAPGEKWPVNAWPLNGKPNDCLVWCQEKVVNASYIIPQIAAYITTDARIRLWLGAAAVLKRGGDIYYMDTDSVMSSLPFPDSIVGAALGMWKREYENIALEGDFILPKLYRLMYHDLDCDIPECQGCKMVKDETSTQKMKGVPQRDSRTNKSLQTPENYEKMKRAAEKARQGGCRFCQLSASGNLLKKCDDCKSLEIHFHRLEQHRSLLSRLASMQSVNDDTWHPELMAAHKGMRSRYDKRVEYPDGRTRPFVVVNGRMT